MAVLSETCLADFGQISEDTSGYTFFWSSLPSSDKYLHGIALVMKISIAKNMQSHLCAINERVICVRFPIWKKRHAAIIGAYAPTMGNTEPVKENIYSVLHSLITKTPFKDKLSILGDFNVLVSRDNLAWPKTIGPHATGKCNSNGLLLALCHEHQLIITNTFFQLPLIYKSTRRHPRSKHWHLINYIIIRIRDVQDVSIMRVMWGVECNTDLREIGAQAFLSNPL